MPLKTKKWIKGKKIILAFLLFFTAIAMALHIFIKRYLPPLVKEQLTTIIVKGSDSLYRVNMGNFDLSFWGGSANLKQFAITVDSTRYAQLDQVKRLPSLTFTLQMNEASLQGLSIWDFIFSKKVTIDAINFKKAKVKLARHFKTNEETKSPDEPLWKLIKPEVNSIVIKQIRCNQMEAVYQNIDSARSFFWKFEKADILITKIRIDSNAAADTSRLLYAENIAVAANDIKIATPDGLYQLAAKKISYASSIQSLQLTGFSFLPIVSNDAFKKHFGYQHETYKIKTDDIVMKDFNLPEWINYNRLAARKIELKSPSVSVYLDRNAKPSVFSKKGKYPHQLLQKAPFEIDIPLLIAKNASVTYSETNDKSGKTGSVTFQSLEGKISNITNVKKKLAQNASCTIDINGRVLKTGHLSTRFRFDLTSKAGTFDVDATITNLTANQLQPMFKAMTGVDLESLDMKKIEYSITGNEDIGKVDLRMEYANMEILLNKITDEGTFKKQGLLSFIANKLAIYNENPHKDEERTAHNITLKRDPTRSFFNLIWKTMFNAAGEIVLRPVAQRKMEKKKSNAKKK